TAAGPGEHLDHARCPQIAEPRRRDPPEPALGPVALVRTRDDLDEPTIASVARTRIDLALHQREQQPVRDRELRDQRLGLRRDERVERALVPRHVSALRRLLLDELALLLGIGRGLDLESLVLDHVLGRLGDDRAARFAAATTGSPRDRFDVPDAEEPGAVPVEVAEPGETPRK